MKRKLMITFQPYLVGVLTPNRTLTEWRLVFIISCVILVVTNIVYLIFASGETQAWNTPVQTKLIENGVHANGIKENETHDKTEKDEKKDEEQSKDEPKL